MQPHVVLSLGEFAVSAAAALLLFAIHREYPKLYLRSWIAAWLAITAFHFLETIPVESEAAAFGKSILLTLTILFGSSWLLFGTFDVSIRRPLRRNIRETILIGSAIVIVAGYAGGAFIPPDLRELAAAALRASLKGTIFLAIAVIAWRGRTGRRRTSMLLLSIAIGINGVFHTMLAVFAKFAPDLVVAHDIVDLTLEAVTASAMVLVAFHDEREESELATSEIEALAYHDSLTGLPNRALFFDRLVLTLAQASRDSGRVAVFFFDIDRFKNVNDSLGHAVGDLVLRQIAVRVRDALRLGDTLARFGGDEFTLLLPSVQGIAQLESVAKKVVDIVRQPIVIGGRSLIVTTSIGISLFPDDAPDSTSLLRNADAAMYRAKEQGGDGYRLFAPAMNANALATLELENGLRRALELKQLDLEYQPIFDLRLREVVGAEALIRWRHPSLGTLLPEHFLRVADLSGLMVPIGAWVLETACTQAARWQRETGKNLGVTVNVSARQLSDPSLERHVLEALAGSSLPAHLLTIEIAETAATRHVDYAVSVLRRLRDIGVQISLDAFGEGESSLSSLHRLPANCLKVRTSFGAEYETGSRSIAAAVIGMAHSLGMKVVGAAVEDRTELEFLVTHECDFAQGRFLAPPAGPDSIVPLLRETIEGRLMRFPVHVA